MRLYSALKLVLKILKEYKTMSPNKSYSCSSGEKTTIDELILFVENLCSWVYKDLSSEDIELIVRCKKCKFYRKYRQKGAFKPQTFYACSKDMKKRDPMFFCKDGDLKDGVQ